MDGVDGSAVVAAPYHYANNDPVDMADPLGLRPTEDVGGLSLPPPGSCGWKQMNGGGAGGPPGTRAAYQASQECAPVYLTSAQIDQARGYGCVSRWQGAFFVGQFFCEHREGSIQAIIVVAVIAEVIILAPAAAACAGPGFIACYTAAVTAGGAIIPATNAGQQAAPAVQSLASNSSSHVRFVNLLKSVQGSVGSSSDAFNADGSLSARALLGAQKIQEGTAMNNPAVTARLGAQGNLADWAKYSTETFTSPIAGGYQIHFYMNRVTQVIDYKIKFNGGGGY